MHDFARINLLLSSVFTFDHIGRPWTLYWGATDQVIAMFLAGDFARLDINARNAGNTSRVYSFCAEAASSFHFHFNLRRYLAHNTMHGFILLIYPH